MANYEILKNAIQNNYEWDNGENKIEGPDVEQCLLALINSLGANYQYAGLAKLTPTPNDPGTPDQNVFYIPTESGTYANFGGLVVADGEVAIFKYNGTWQKDSTGAASAKQLNQLGQEVNGNFTVNTKSVPYTSGANITKNNTILNVSISPGETFWITLNVTMGITSVKSFIVFANNTDIDQLTDATSNTLLVNTKKKYVASAQINNIRVYMAGSNITANGTLTMVVEKGDKGVMGVLKRNDLLLPCPVACASTEVTRTGEQISQIVYKNEDGATIRTDNFTYGDNAITEERILSSGESVRITTDLSTYNQVIVWN